jgi:hypothetical protein
MGTWCLGVLASARWRADGGTRARRRRPHRRVQEGVAMACRAAGCPGLLIHDFRRTAARTLRMADVDREHARLFTRARTDAMFERYNVDDDLRLREATEKFTAYITQQRTEAAKAAAHPTVPTLPRSSRTVAGAEAGEALLSARTVGCAVRAPRPSWIARWSYSTRRRPVPAGIPAGCTTRVTAG